VRRDAFCSRLSSASALVPFRLNAQEFALVRIPQAMAQYKSYRLRGLHASRRCEGNEGPSSIWQGKRFGTGNSILLELKCYVCKNPAGERSNPGYNLLDAPRALSTHSVGDCIGCLGR